MLWQVLLLNKDEYHRWRRSKIPEGGVWFPFLRRRDINFSCPTLQGPPGIFFIIRWCNIKSQMKPSGWFYMVLLWKFGPGRKKEWGYQAHSRVGVDVIFLERGVLILARREDVSHPPCPPVHKHPCTFIPWWFSYKIYVQRFICFIKLW